MSIIFSRECEYALQAVLYLALKPEGKATSIRDLTKRLNIPYHFLGKILQHLTRKGLLASVKGPSGGFALAKPSKNITLFDVVEAIDGESFMRGCVLGFVECSQENPCALHAQWKKSRDGIFDILSRKNIGQLGSRMRKPQYRS